MTTPALQSLRTVPEDQEDAFAISELSHDIPYTVNGMVRNSSPSRATFSEVAFIRPEKIEDIEWLVFLKYNNSYGAVARTPLSRIRIPFRSAGLERHSNTVYTTYGNIVAKGFSLEGYALPVGKVWHGRYDFARVAKEILGRSTHPQRGEILRHL